MHQLDTVADPALFRTARTAERPVKVDRKANIIFGANLMQVGDLNGGDARNWTVDAATLQQAHEIMGRGNNGTKARFTHPNMSADGMGSYLGRWKNQRVDGGTLRADLHIADAAFRSPQGDLGTYVMDLAESDPEAFGVSLATRLDEGNLQEFSNSSDGKDGKKWPMRFADVRAADIVDEPAATRGGLFDLTTPDLRNLPAQATALLTTYFGDAEPIVVRGRIDAFLDRYFSTKDEATVPEIETTETPVEVIEETEVTPEVETSAAGTADLSATTATADLTAIERERCKKIRVLVDLAGVPERFNQFVDNGFSVDETQKALRDCLAKKNPGLSSVAPAEPVVDKDADLKAEYADMVKFKVTMGQSEADYIAHARRNAG